MINLSLVLLQSFNKLEMVTPVDLLMNKLRLILLSSAKAGSNTVLHVYTACVDFVLTLYDTAVSYSLD